VARVLIVDDDENNRLLLATLLEYAGHIALEAADGRTGAQMAAHEHPDVVIVDLSLPDISGVELIRNLRSHSATANVPIALYTATQMTPAIRELIETYNVNGIIPKPGEPQQILGAFESLLGKRDGDGQAAESG
jgi:CheY-like chemotaxis protein